VRQLFGEHGGMPDISAGSSNLFGVSGSEKAEFPHLLKNIPGKLSLVLPLISMRCEFLFGETTNRLSEHLVLVSELRIAFTGHNRLRRFDSSGFRHLIS
jgi:hypothetical protein